MNKKEIIKAVKKINKLVTVEHKLDTFTVLNRIEKISVEILTGRKSASLKSK